jgi:hypothetical protein
MMRKAVLAEPSDATLLPTEARRDRWWIHSVQARAVNTDQRRGSQPWCRLTRTGSTGFLDDLTRRSDTKMAGRRQLDSQDAQPPRSATDHPGGKPGM